MEATIYHKGIIVLGDTGIMEKNMETTIESLGLRVLILSVHRTLIIDWGALARLRVLMNRPQQ